VIDDGAVADAMASFARPATSGPIRLVLGRHEVKVAPRVYAPAITLAADGARLKPVLDIEALVKALKPVSSTVPGRPVSARIVVDHGRPRVIPSRRASSSTAPTCSASSWPPWCARPVTAGS
jgi:hypothetical protein